MDSNRVPWWRVGALAAFAALLAACGGGEEGSSQAQEDHPPNVGSGWVTISSPSGDYSTDFDSASLSGKAFISKGYYRCCSGTAEDTGVTVGCAGCRTTQSVRYASLGFGIPWVSEHTWRATVPLAMGTHIIVVEARDPGGNIGYDSVRVTRVADTRPPDVLGVFPLDGAIDVSTKTTVSVNFTDAMSPGTLTPASFVVTDPSGNPVAGSVSVESFLYRDSRATFRPAGALIEGTTYTASVSASVRDKAGNLLPAPHTWAFTTKGVTPAPAPTPPAPPPPPLPPDTTPPAIASVSPSEGSACAVPDGNVRVTFTEPVDAATVSSSSFALANGAAPVPGSLASVWNSAILTPAGRLAYSTTYTATVTTAIRDHAGNALTANRVWSFSTVPPGTGTWRATPEGFATPRAKHTAVWTGSEMLVWGGSVIDPSVRVLGDGFRYHPAADAWSPMAAAGAPSPRQEHVAVWTGTEMIAWGGRSLDPWSWFSDGARYDPGANVWIPISSAGAPSASLHTVAVWSGTEMLVWNGTGGARYHPVSDTWQPIPYSAYAPFSAFTAVWTGSKLILWGVGSTGEAAGAAYDPAANSWAPIAQAGDPFRLASGQHTAVWTGTEMIVWGGSFLSPEQTLLDLGGAYNPATDSWRPIAGCGTAERSRHTAAWTGSEMLIWGGRTGGNESTDTGRAYNPVSDSWRELGFVNAPAPRDGHTAVWTGAEMIVWGGGDDAAVQFASGARFAP